MRSRSYEVQTIVVTESWTLRTVDHRFKPECWTPIVVHTKAEIFSVEL